MYTNQCSNVLVQTNILVTNKLARANGNNLTTSPNYTNNRFFGSTDQATAGTNTITAAPRVNPTVDPCTANFRVAGTSQASNTGINNALLTNDLASNPRASGSTVDLGSYEYTAPATVGLSGGTSDWNTATNWTAGAAGVADETTIPTNTAPYPALGVDSNGTVKTLSTGPNASPTLRSDLRNAHTVSAQAGTLTLNGTTAALRHAAEAGQLAADTAYFSKGFHAAPCGLLAHANHLHQRQPAARQLCQ